ncbi:MAG: ATP-binding domain-containing protein [Bacteroidetes bacterium]|nr:ATP-binding domain-containing protein [Bacteroidota bacterium]
MFKFSFITRADIAATPSGRNMLKAVDLPMEGSEKHALLLTGCPGSGKTTVIAHRLANLADQDKEYLFLFLHILLKIYLRNVMSEAGVAPDNIINIHKWFGQVFHARLTDGSEIRADYVRRRFEESSLFYDEILFDEAQDLWGDLFGTLSNITNHITVSCDNAQDVMEQFGDHDIYNSLDGILSKDGFQTHLVPLTTNYRNSRPIYDLAKSFIPHEQITEINGFHRPEGEKPKLHLVNGRQELEKRIAVIVGNNRNVNVGILCEKVTQIDHLYKFLTEQGINCTKFHYRLSKEAKDAIEGNVEAVLIATLQSAKGLEFETVIMPFIEDYSLDDKKLRQYYVGCTRAKQELHLVCSGSISQAFVQIDSSLFENIES